MEYTPESEDALYRACINSLGKAADSFSAAKQDPSSLASYKARVEELDGVELQAFESTIDQALQKFNTGYSGIVFLIDEFDIVLEREYSVVIDFFRHLRTILSRPETKIAMVLTGSYRCYEVLAGPGSPLHTILKTHFLEPLSQKDAERLMMLPRLDTSSSNLLTQSDMDLIFDRTGGHPYLIQCLMHSLRGLGVLNVTEQILKEIEDKHQFKMLFQSWYEKLEERERWLYEVLAASVPEIYMTVAQLYDPTLSGLSTLAKFVIHYRR